MKKEALLTVFLLSGLTSMAQTNITNYTPGVSTEGVVYYLPKTAINVNITIEKSNYAPGELCQYAERYLRISNISKAEDIHYTLKSTTLTTEGLPDASKAYHIKFATNTVAPLVNLSESGLLISINTPHTPEEKAVTASTSKSLSPLPNPRDYMTEEMLMTGSKAKLAELVAKEIYDIRESRNLLLRGQNENVPKDGEAMNIILDGMQKQEQALLQLFTGTTTTETITQTFQIIPEGNAEKVILGRFSRKLGLLHPDDLAGMPIYIDIKGSNTVAKPVEEPQSTQKGKSKTKVTKENKQDGIVYNVPERATVKVYTNSQTLAEETLSVSQFGNTETLSSTFFSKKKNIKVTLDPHTGALLKVEEQTN
jgi:hypothetical protein